MAPFYVANVIIFFDIQGFDPNSFKKSLGFAGISRAIDEAGRLSFCEMVANKDTWESGAMASCLCCSCCFMTSMAGVA